MRQVSKKYVWTMVGTLNAVSIIASVTHSQESAPKGSSYAPVDIKENFADTMAWMKKDKPAVMKRQMDLLAERYDLSNRPAKGVTMSRGKPVQEGVRAKLPTGVTWEQLGGMSPEDIQAKGMLPKGFLPLPHPNHPEGGIVFPKFHIDEIRKQEGRELTRFDLDFDLPDHFLPEFPAPIYLTTRPDLSSSLFFLEGLQIVDEFQNSSPHSRLCSNVPAACRCAQFCPPDRHLTVPVSFNYLFTTIDNSIHAPERKLTAVFLAYLSEICGLHRENIRGSAIAFACESMADRTGLFIRRFSRFGDLFLLRQSHARNEP